MSRGRIALLAIGVFTAAALGWLGSEIRHARRQLAATSESTDSPCPGGVRPLYWKAPMDPTYVRPTPGKSPMGMDLVPECPSEAGRGDEGSVVVDSATLQTIGVRTATVERRDLSRSVRAVGRVAVDERRVSHVHTKVQGWVEELLIDFVGQTVERGQPLLEIYSPELVATQEELLLAHRYRQSTGESPFDAVRGGGEALFAATMRRLELWDIPDRDIERLLETREVTRTLTLYAPSSGVVTELGVRSGMKVGPEDNLYTIADLSSVWVLADVYEYELPWIEVGQAGLVELTSLPGRRLEGRVTYVSPFLDARTRTAEIRIELANDQGALKPEMFGTAIISGTSRPDALTIPQDAVIRSGRRTLAIVSLGGGRFDPREIELGLDSGDGFLEVLDGLSEGEEIVVSSQFLIDSESNLKEALHKLRADGHPADDAEARVPTPEPPPSHGAEATPVPDHAHHHGHEE